MLASNLVASNQSCLMVNYLVVIKLAMLATSTQAI